MSEAPSPVRLYKEQKYLEKKTVYLAQESINLSQAGTKVNKKPLKKNHLISEEGNLGLLDRIRVQKFRAEQRKAKELQTLNAKSLLPDDGDHGEGLWKRKAQITEGIKDIIHQKH